VNRRFYSSKKPFMMILLIILTLTGLIISRMTQDVYAATLNLGNLPRPFVSSSKLMNSSTVVASSVGHGPCGGCHTMDVMGAIMVAAKLGLESGNGTMESIMDDSVSSYNVTSGQFQFNDMTSNLIVIGGPGVNQVAWYYNGLEYPNGSRVLLAFFSKFGNGTDNIYVAPTNNYYAIQYDSQGRVSADYGLVEVLNDHGRYALLLGGLGGAGTWAACKVISTFDSYTLTGCAAIVKYSDSNGDGFLDTLSIVEQVGGTISYFNVFAPLSFGVFLVALVPKLRILKDKLTKKRLLVIACFVLFIVVAAQTTFTVRSDNSGPEVYTFNDLSHPFVSAGGLLNSTAVVASSVGHGPCGGCHTMDVMGGVMVGAQFGMDATGGSLDATLDDYITDYNLTTAQLTFHALTNNLLLIGGPGVNQVTWYYNNLRNGSGARVLPVYFDKFPNGTDYIYVASTDHYYTIERDSQGRVSADYGIVTLYYDASHGWWVVIAAGLGGPGTTAASRLLATYKDWSLFGQSIIVKYADTNGDGYLDTISVPEIIGVGKSIDVFWDANCMNPVSSIDWGTLSPGDVENITVFVRNEGESGTVLALNVSDWNPLPAASYLNIGWNYSGTTVPPGQVLPLTLSMVVNESISGITDFGVNVTVSSGG
jgi:hypothetical protein